MGRTRDKGSTKTSKRFGSWAVIVGLLQWIVPVTPVLRFGAWLVIAGLVVAQIWEVRAERFTMALRAVASVIAVIVVSVTAWTFWPSPEIDKVRNALAELTAEGNALRDRFAAELNERPGGDIGTEFVRRVDDFDKRLKSYVRNEDTLGERYVIRLENRIQFPREGLPPMNASYGESWWTLVSDLARLNEFTNELRPWVSRMALPRT